MSAGGPRAAVRVQSLVVGGGISGLVTAHALRRLGQDVALLEASDRLGGNIQTHSEHGFIAEDGPNGYLDREPRMAMLVEQLGLTSRLRIASTDAKRRFIVRHGALCEVPSSPPAFLKSNVLPWTAKLRLLGELFSRRGKPGEDESLAAFFRRHIGRTATRILVDAVQTGIFAGNAERLSALATFPRLGQLELAHRSLVLGMLRTRRPAQKALPAGAPEPGTSGAMCTFDEGLGVLPKALGAALGKSVHLLSKVGRIQRSEGGWTVALEGSSEFFQAGQLVLATPADVSARLLAPLDAELCTLLEGIEHAPVAVVHLGYAAAHAFPTPPGFGFLAAHHEGLDLLGTIYVSSTFPFRAPPGAVLLTCMLGGAQRPELVAQPESVLVRTAQDTVARLLGLHVAPSYTRLVRWPRGIPQYNVGHLARILRIRELERRHAGLHLTGNAFEGVGLNDCVRVAVDLAQRMVSGAPALAPPAASSGDPTPG